MKDIEGNIAKANHLGVQFEDVVKVDEAKSGSQIPTFFHRFIEYCKQNYSPANLHSDLARIRSWQDFFARKKMKYLEQITPGVVNEYFTTVLRGKKPKTLKNHLTLLKTALNCVVEWELMGSNPVAKVRAPKITKTFKFFDKKEVKRLIK